MARSDHVIRQNDRTGAKICLSRPWEPMTHDDACRFKAAVMNVSGQTNMLMEATSRHPMDPRDYGCGLCPHAGDETLCGACGWLEFKPPTLPGPHG